MAHKNDSYQHEEDDYCDTTKKANIISIKKHEAHDHDELELEEEEDGDDHDHDGEGDESLLKSRWALWLSLGILLGFIIVSMVFKIAIPKTVEIVLMGIAYVLAGH